MPKIRSNIASIEHLRHHEDPSYFMRMNIKELVNLTARLIGAGLGKDRAITLVSSTYKCDSEELEMGLEKLL